MTLYVKFVWFTILTMFVSSLISFFAMNIYYDMYLKAENNAKNLAIANSIALSTNGNSFSSAEDTFHLLGDVGYQLYLTDGQTVFRYGGTFREEDLDDHEIQKVLDAETFNGIRDYPRGLFVTGFFTNELKNSVGVNIEIDEKDYALFLRPNINLLFQELHFLFGGLAIGIILLSFIGMLVVARFLIQPITKLTDAIEKLGEERFDVPLSIHRSDEIGRLADHFVQSRNRIEESIIRRKEFVHNVSHDIQSPLHTIQSHLSLLQKPGLGEDDKRKYMTIVQSETARLSSLTAQLLTLASFDKESIEMIEEVDIRRQLETILSHLRYAFDKKELGVSAHFESVTVKGNAVLLETVWENLLINSIKYSEPGGIIEITLSVINEEIIVTIQDEGIGMTEEEVAHAFEKFYRADKTRDRSIEGSGLGLSIVKEIIDLHKGSIEIDSTPDIGTSVRIHLPL